MNHVRPLHHTQIVRSLPHWSQQLPADTLRQVLGHARKPYLDTAGTPYPWYGNAPILDQQALLRALDQRQASLATLQRQLAPLQGISAFCTPLLQAHLGLETSVLQAQYLFQPTEVHRPTTPPSGPNVPDELLPVVAKGKPQVRNLLEAALHNFEGTHDTTRLSRLQRAVNDPIAPLGLSVAGFIEQCRALDLGQRYQAHLSEVYDGAAAAAIRSAAIAARQDDFRVQVRIAAMKGTISAGWSTHLQGLCTNAPASRTLHCWQLAPFGVPIHELFMVRAAEAAEDPGVVLYWPHSPEPVHAFASLAAASSYLRTALADRDTRKRFIALAPHALQAELLGKLEHALFENSDADADTPRVPRRTVHLEVTEHPLDAAMWAHLETQHISRLKGDARRIAVPTADVDREVRLKQLAHWLDIGLTVLNVAAMCVPVLNPLMLAIGAAQITGSVFEGIAAWEDGDNAQALAQLESIALNLALGAAVAGAGVTLQASGFVDALCSVKTDVAERLWQPSLRGYASNVELPLLAHVNALGQYVVEGRTYVRIDASLYEQFLDAQGAWRVRHPSDSSAYAPLLSHNGEGAWRLALDTPLEWDMATLIRRLGQADDSLSEHDLHCAWRTTGLGPEVLQAVHLDATALPARFKALLARLRADLRVSWIIEQVREGGALPASDNFALPALVELPGWPQDHLIEAFSGSERFGASTLYGRLPRQAGDVVVQISRSELEGGRLAHWVLMQLDDPAVFDLATTPPDARIGALQTRLAEHLLAQRSVLVQRLYDAAMPALSPAGSRLAAQFPGLPADTVQAIVAKASRLERQALLDPAAHIPLRVLEEARVMLAQVRLDRALLGLYRPALANLDTSVLIEALQARHPGLSGEALWELAVEQRALCAEALGQQPIQPGYRSPMRLNHGPLGYPLSGRAVPRRVREAALRRLQALYPALDDATLGELQAQLARTGDLGESLRGLESEQATLIHHLHEWAQAGADAIERDERFRCAERIRNSWRRLASIPRDTLTLEHLHISRLPSITARFPHVRALVLENLALREIDGQFLERFPNLERLRIAQNVEIDAEALFQALRAAPHLVELDLSSSGLVHLGESAEQALSAMRQLRVLILRRNRLIMDAPTLGTLTRLRLDRLNLSSNAIVLDETQALGFQSLVHPQELRLDFNPLGVAPDLRFMARLNTLSMTNCDLHTWPEGLTTLMNQPQYQLRLIDLSRNRIHALPDLDALMASPFVRDLAARLPERRWRMNYNGLEYTARARLLSAGANVLEEVGEMPRWQFLWRAHAAPAQNALWEALFAHGQNQALEGVLERLAMSAEAQNGGLGLRHRVWIMLQRASEDDALLQVLNDDAHAFPATCGDAGADAFSALEIRLLIQDASLSADPLGEQWRVFGQLYRREQVNLLAERIAWRRSVRQAALLEAEITGDEASLPELDVLDDVAVMPDLELIDGLVDDIEIRLALRQALAADLDYPEPSVGMLYQQIARVNERVRANVLAAVRQLDQDAQARRQWVLEQPQWQRAVRQHYLEQFEALTDFWRSALDYLDYCLDEQAEALTQLPPSVRTLLEATLGQPLLDDAGTLRRVAVNSAQYQAASERILQQLRDVEHGLLESLTRAIEQRHSSTAARP